MSVDPKQVVSLLVKEFGADPRNGPNHEEKEIARYLIEILKDFAVGNVKVRMSETLEMEDDGEYDQEWSAEDEHCKQLYPEMATEEEITFGEKAEKIEDVLRAVEYYYGRQDGHCRKLETMTNQFKFIKNNHHLTKLAHIHREGRVRIDRRAGLLRLKTLLINWVEDRLKNGIEIHDIDLQTQALKFNRSGQAQEELVPKFTASHRWIQKFKKAHRIVSRKVTRFVAKKTFDEEEALKEKAEEFVKQTVLSLRKHQMSDKAIFNADQMGIDFELHSKRALAKMGEKVVERVAQSVSSLTHSYTVLPMIGKDGILGEKLFVVIAEPTGAFPKGVKFPSNLEVRASKSHIMGKELTKDWLKSCVFTPTAPKKMALVLDSFGPFKDHDMIEGFAPSDGSVLIYNIPAHCTRFVQPLDRYFNHIFKAYIRHIHTYIISNDIPFAIRKRENVLKVLSFTYHQFRHISYKFMIRYSWYCTKYDSLHPPAFETPVEFCFKSHEAKKCEEATCHNISFLRCSYCKKSLCFDHTINGDHKCV